MDIIIVDHQIGEWKRVTPNDIKARVQKELNRLGVSPTDATHVIRRVIKNLKHSTLVIDFDYTDFWNHEKSI